MMKDLRMQFLVNFDEHIKAIGDEDILAEWFAQGLPDGYDSEDLECIAEDDAHWKGVCELFGELINQAPNL